MISCVINGYECRGRNDGGFDGLHGFLMQRLPCEGGALVCKVSKRASNGGEVLDPNAHVSCDAKERMDISEVLAAGPVADLVDFGVVRNASFVIALVSKDGDCRDCDEELHHGDGGSGAEEPVEYAVDVAEVLPNEVADLWVSKDRLVPTTLDFVTRLWSLDGSVVDKG